jgi:peptidyl-prolyl cis-trans isomerase C
VLSSLPPIDGDQDARRDPSAEPPEPQNDPTPEPPYSDLFTRDDVERAEASAADDDRADADGVPPADPDDDEEADEAPRRPPILAIVVSALLLVALGVGMGYYFAPRPVAAPIVPTTDPAVAGAIPTPMPTPDLPRPVDTIADDQAVAKVNDTTLTFADFKRSFSPGADPTGVISQMIQVELVVQAATAEGATIDQTAIDAQIEEIKTGQAGGDDAAFLAFLQQNNIGSIEDLKALLERQQLIEAAMKNHTLIEQARARHILLSATPDTLESRKAEAEALLKELEGGADFAAAALEKSEDPGSKETGGDLGWAPRGIFVEEFDKAIFEMEANEIRLISTQFGWHIIQVLDPAEVRPLENQQFMQSPAGQEAFATSFLPWVEKLQADAEAAGKVERLVEPTSLVTAPATP